MELIRKINQSSKIKKINQSYFKLADTFQEIVSNIKGVKSVLKEQKELVVCIIESVKEFVSINSALKIFKLYHELSCSKTIRIEQNRKSGWIKCN